MAMVVTAPCVGCKYTDCVVVCPCECFYGDDRQLYVDLFASPGVARMDLDGSETGRWPIPQAVGPLQIATGFGLDIWITDTSGGKIFELTPYNTGR